MLTKVEIVNSQNQVLLLPFGSTTGGYFVKDIKGLDPVNANVATSKAASNDGERKQNIRRVKRNMILQLGLLPNYSSSTVQSLRLSLYAFFMPQQEVTIKFFNGTTYIASIKAFVEVNDSPLFVKDPSINISAICTDPDFLKPSYTTVSGNSTNTNVEKTVMYPGTSKTGFIFTLYVNHSLTNVKIYRRRPNNTVELIEFENALVSGDVVKISTEANSKYASRLRASVLTSAVFAVKPISKWFPLEPGNNYISVVASGISIPYTIEYRTRYGGL